MNNEELNTALYKKMFAEQEKYRDWLLTQPPEEILHHTYEYTVREDILMTAETNDFSDERASALLSSPSPLADIFKDFEKIETGYMDIVRDCIENRADDILKKQHELRDTPLYMQTSEYAHEHGELPVYRESNKVNIACKKAIEDAIRSNYANNCLNTKVVYEQIKEQFGTERLNYVLANTVQAKDWDGRISNKNKAWAKTIPVCQEKDAWGGTRNAYFVVDQAHPGLVDLLVTHIRKELEKEKEQPEKKPSVLQKLKEAKAEAQVSTPKKAKEVER